MSVATLGIAVDSSQAASASAVLDQLAAISRNTAATVAALEANANAMASALSNISRGAAPATASIKTLQQAVQAYAADLTKATGAVNDMTSVGQTRLDQLRAKYSPLFAAQQQYRQQLGDLKDAQQTGALSQGEYADALTNTKVAFIQQVNALRPGRDALEENSAAAEHAAAAHAGLTTQAMSAQHAIRGMVEQLALGVPPTQALTAQMNHLVYASSGPGGLSGALQGAIAPLRGLLSAGVLTFGGIAVTIGAATLALNSYLSAQNKVQASTLGAGRASGATSTSINTIASQGSSTFGLSTSEARDLASALASTGKVANDNILPIVQMGHDIAIAFGTDATGATKLLADAFSDPVKGADQLNQRLGFLDASTKQNITNLVAQNNQYGATKSLIDATKTSLAGFADTQDSVTKGWAALGNAASNAWGAVGKAVASALGLGTSLEDRLDAAKQKLADLKASGGMTVDLNTGGMSDAGSGATAAAQADVDKYTAAIQRNALASITAADAQKSFLQQSTIRDLTPEISQQEALNNQLKVLQSLFDSLSNDEGAGERLKALGTTFEIIAAAIAKAHSQVDNFKSSYQQALDSQKTQLASITAFSPNAKGDIVYQQTLNDQLAQGVELTKATTLAAGARTIAIKSATTALSEQARTQILTANQSVVSATLDVSLVGKSIQQQTLLTANLASRQQLEQIASQNRTGFNQAEYDQLTKINAKIAEQKQLAAQAAAQDNANFSLQTAFLTDIDQQIASVQKQLHGNDWPQYMNDGLAATMRIADSVKQLSSALSGQLTTGLADIFDGTKSASQGFADLGKTVLRTLEEAAIKAAIVGPLIKAAFGGSAGGGLLSLLGIGGNFGDDGVNLGSASSPLAGLTAADYAANGKVFDYSNVVPFAKGGTFTNSIVSQPTLFKFANGTGMMGEAGPEAIMPLTRGPNGKLGVAAHGAANSNTPSSSVSFGDTHISIQGNADDKTVQALTKQVSALQRSQADLVKQAQSSQRYSASGVG